MELFFENKENLSYDIHFISHNISIFFLIANERIPTQNNYSNDKPREMLMVLWHDSMKSV